MGDDEQVTLLARKLRWRTGDTDIEYDGGAKYSIQVAKEMGLDLDSKGSDAPVE